MLDSEDGNRYLDIDESFYKNAREINNNLANDFYISTYDQVKYKILKIYKILKTKFKLMVDK